MTRAKRQHFIPRFYLKSFDDRLFCYDKLEDCIVHTNIRSIALGKYFYEVEGLDDGLIEKFLSENETKFSRAYYELLEKRDITKLSRESREDFFRFMAVQFLRTEQYRLQLEDITSQALTTFAKKFGKLPDYLKISYDPETIKVMHIEMILRHSSQFAHIFANKKWEIIEASGGIPLWTSDSPVALDNTLDFGPFMGNRGLMSKGIEIHFPLTNNLNLLSFDSTTHRLRRDTGSDVEQQYVIHENMLQLQSSSRFVYASSMNDFDRAKDFLSKYPQFKNPKRQRMQVY